jgi:rhamnose utilization protein RhaD (predicted bifunctional aldolase and dehydrogenase)
MREPGTMFAHDPELASLEQVSASLGRDPDLVQGAGGNTALKIRDVIWVKASGKLLARATDEPIFTPLDLNDVARIAVAARRPGFAQHSQCSPPQGLRPAG